ncbi:hypothetical protein [Candidatus Chlorohelix sp.]|uniref:hypothetical protein n=1 Tax=Candidatus Chlorohelix sp. TaxID=3139201 RepID=UPI003048E645
MGYELIVERKQHQKCDNCIFIKSCFLQEVQRLQENSGIGNDCLIYQDERDLPEAQRTERYNAVAGLPTYTVRMRKPL